MKVIFIIQGEGRGHLTQAMTMEKLLEKHGHKVVEMWVGKSKSRTPPEFFAKKVNAEVKYFESINFVPSGDNKKPNMLKSFFSNVFMVFKYFSSIKLLRNYLKHSDADLIVNFYEVLGSLAYLFSSKKMPMVGIGHQFLFLHKDFNLPKKGYEEHVGLNLFSKFIAYPCSRLFALSFRKMDNDLQHKINVVPPLLREEVREFRDVQSSNNQYFRNGDYILGYIAYKGYIDEIREWHKENPDIPLHFFWDNKEVPKLYKEDENIIFYYLDDKEFLNQMAGCRAYASTAGFESICEAMYLEKPLLMVPTHIEQKCNAYDATLYNAAVSADTFNLSILLDFAKNKYVKDINFCEWVNSSEDILMANFNDVVEEYNKKVGK